MFIPRQPVVDNQFCEYVETDTTGGVGGAGALGQRQGAADTHPVLSGRLQALLCRRGRPQ